MPNWHNSPSLREAALLAGKQYVADVEAGKRNICLGWVSYDGKDTCLVGEMARAVGHANPLCVETAANALGLDWDDVERAILKNDNYEPRAGLEYLASLPFGEE